MQKNFDVWVAGLSFSSWYRREEVVAWLSQWFCFVSVEVWGEIIGSQGSRSEDYANNQSARYLMIIVSRVLELYVRSCI